MKYQIPQPEYWQEFEDLCLHLWRDIWGDPNAQKNGRSGQNQKGVDIYGVASFDGKPHGVQCKGKNANYGARLTKDEIRDEAINADKNKTLSSFIMATTSPRDIELQEYCRELNEAKVHGFTVDVWSWDEIQEELQYRKDIALNCGLPFIDREEDSSSIKMGKWTGKERLQAFMTRPKVEAEISRTMRILLYKVFYEIMQNAFIHGKATQCMLVYKDNSFVVMDNGNPFNPKILLSSVGRGGSLTMNKLAAVCCDSISFNYEYNADENERKNVFVINISADRLASDYYNSIEFFVDRNFQVQNRIEPMRLAESHMNMLSDEDAASVLFSDQVPVSCVREYVRRATSIVGADRIQVSLPHSAEYMKETIKEFTPKVIIR